MLTIPIYDTILLPEVTFYFKKEVIDGWDLEDFNVGDIMAFAMLREDIDITEVAINLSSAELTYSAALQATGKIIQNTLLNYI